MSTAVRTSEDRATALGERVIQALLGTLDLAGIHLGERLGLYTALRDGGPMTSIELAERTGTAERYIREWLEQQAVTGVLDVEDVDAAPTSRRYVLPDGHVEALTDADSLAYLPPLGRITIGVLQPMTQLIEAFRTGKGVPYADYGEDTREGIAAMNRVMFHNQLGSEWFPAIADIHARLAAAPAKVADIGSGTGASSIAIARAYPLAMVDTFDIDPASVARARDNIAAAGLADRVTARRVDAGGGELDGTYDLVTIFEALHDMARPVEALRSARQMLADGGSVIVADERVADRFTAPGDDLERIMYGCSIVHCLAVCIADHEQSAATGTVMRTDTLRRYAADAGFASVEVLPIENDFWRFYRLYP